MAVNWQVLLGVDKLRESARFWLDESSIAVADRVALANIEWKRQRNALISAILFSALALFCICGLLILGSIGILLSWQNTQHWSLVLTLVLLGWFLLIVVSGVLIKRAVSGLSSPFTLTRQVLQEDWEILKAKL